MMIRRIVCWAWMVLLVAACAAPRPLAMPTPDGQNLVSFIIVQLNDVYEIAPLEGGKSGGLARVATVIDELKAENPNVISVMAGDFLSPSFSNTLRLESGEKIAGLQMIETLNAMGLDYATFGNHEFDFSEVDLLQKRLNTSTFRYLSSNVREVTEQGQRPFRQEIDGELRTIPDYIVHTFRNATGQAVRVAIVGTTLPFSIQPYLAYLPWDDTFVQAVSKAKMSADLVLGLTHLNMEQDQALARRVLPVPLIMGGHEHDQRSDYIENTIITKANANAKTIYIHRIMYDPQTGMSDIRSSVLTIDESIADKASVAAVVNRWQDFTEKAIVTMGYNPGKVVYTATEPLEGSEIAVRSRQTNYGQLTNQAYRAAWPGMDVYAFNAGGLRVDDDLSGEITEYDVLRSYPFGGDIVAVQLPGSALQRLLDTGRKENIATGGYIQRLGAVLADGQWLINDQPLEATRTYSVVMPSFLASGREANLGFLKDYPAEQRATLQIGGQEVRNDVRDLLIAYLGQL